MRNLKYGLYILLAIGLLTSCVSRKKQNLFPYLENMTPDSSAQYEVIRTEYKLQPHDIIDIQITSPVQNLASFFSQTFNASSMVSPQQGQLANSGNDIYYMTGYLVDDSGFVKLPELGAVEVSGLSIRELEALLSQKLLKYFKNTSSFYVKVKLGGIRFSIFGEVNKPGRYVVLESRYNIFQALAHVGDLQVFAERNSLLLQRMKDGRISNYEIDLFAEDIYTQPYFYIQPNDVIYVRQLKSKSYGVGPTFIENLRTVMSLITTTVSLYISYVIYKDK